MMSFKQLIVLVGILPSLLFLTGCEKDMQDLEGFIAEVKTRPGTDPDPLPEVVPYVVPTFVSLDRQRTPFASFQAWEEARAREAAAGKGPRPIAGRVKEHLEQFPLDALAMIGTLEIEGQIFGLVRSAEPRVYRVQVGQYMGRNHGQIIRIADNDILLSELVPNSLGGWNERQAQVAMRQAAKQAGANRR